MSIKDILFGSDEEKAADNAARETENADGALVSRDMLVGEIIMKYPAAADFLMSCGMGCIFCPSSQMETLEMAAMVHGLDAGDICNALNETLAKNLQTDEAASENVKEAVNQ
ncbi:MAG: DUF1858 domain-containing protein [Lachnospiraceae bacterium]|nr:DUF1858 domain-containing protein [Lachnospiraceae bacterium]